MHCKCGRLVEPAYEQNGKCENCYANECVSLDQIEEEKGNSKKPGDVLSWPISELKLDDRTNNILFENGIVLIRDLVKKTDAELIDMRNVGKKTLNAIITALQQFARAHKQQECS